MSRLRVAIALAIGLMLAGCAEEPVAESIPTPPPRKAGEPTPPAEPAKTAPASPISPAPAAPSVAPGATPEAPPVEVDEANYTPPFPEREELFLAPRRNTNVVRTDSDSDTSVELMGFVDVGGKHAVLAINGEVTPLKIGAEKNGVKIWSIDEPSVVLQRGRYRETLTLQ